MDFSDTSTFVEVEIGKELKKIIGKKLVFFILNKID